MIRTLRFAVCFLSSLFLGAAIVTSPSAAQDTKSNDGGDVAFGGFGSEPGKFIELRDLAFDSTGNVFALDGARYDAKTKLRKGNLRVQKFSDDGKLLATMDLRDAATGELLGDRNDPQRLAVDTRGHVFVTQPAAGCVQEFGADGKFVRSIEMRGAMGITTVQTGGAERLAVLPGFKGVVQGKLVKSGGDAIVILTPDGDIERKVTLKIPQPLDGVHDLAADRAGNFYVQAEPNAVYKFAPDGTLLKTFGGNPTTRAEDASEVLHTVAVDSKGNVYTVSWGNPALITRFNADGKMLTQRGGQFKFADPWSAHSAYIILAIDPRDRLWAGATGVHDPKTENSSRYRATPAIVRAKADFFETPPLQVRHSPAYVPGFRPALSCPLPHHVSYEPGKPVPLQYTVQAANRFVDAVTVEWRVWDASKNEVGKGRFDLALKNGEEARADFSFVPPRFGGYFVQAIATSSQGGMGALGLHVGVTPKWPNMPALGDDDGKHGWEDAPRQIWSGLPFMRLHPKKDIAALDGSLKACEVAGLTAIVQIGESLKTMSPEQTREIMERFKGRIKYVEVCNEPNFSGTADDYFRIHKETYAIVKSIDPSVKVMGPVTVNIDLKWLARLYELGFKDVSDIVSTHDYEGHESIDPDHWRWKYGEMRRIMAEHGDGAKPIWQTERAISGVRGRSFQGLVQAIRTAMHRDLLESFGTPSDHNFHYYLNQAGYSSVPTYVWSPYGPHPAAIVLRTRHALTAAMGRKFAGQLDFGPDGNGLFLGVRFRGDNGETVSLRNLGTRDTPLDFEVRGAAMIEVTDAWGNTETVRVADGKVRLTLAQLPSYVRLPRGAEIVAPKMDFGLNVAARATFAYSSTFKGDLQWLNNGIIETYQSGNPNGDTNGRMIWAGDMPADARENPVTLDINFERPQIVDKVVLRGIRADNAFCALLAYDLQYHDGTAWKTIERVDRPMPPSEPARSADAMFVNWMDDTNFFMHQFAPVTTSRLRIVVRATTRGFEPDTLCQGGRAPMPERVMLREVEVFAPREKVAIGVLPRSGAGASGPVPAETVFRISNAGREAWRGELRAFSTAGLSVAPQVRQVEIPAGGATTVALKLTPPPEIPAGTAFVDAELRDAKGALAGASFDAIRIPAPIEIKPEPVNPAVGGTQDLSVVIRNTSGAALSGAARLRLTGPRKLAPLTVPFGPVAAGDSASVEWKVPGIDITGEHWRADFQIVANGIVVAAEGDLARQQWMIVGPFPREFETDFGPEKGVDFSRSFTDAMGNEKKWMSAQPNAEGLVNLADNIKPNTEVLAYAATFVSSPVARKAVFSVGTDDGGKGFVNGRQVYTDDGSHAASPGQQKIPVELKQGRNEILLKVTQGSGGWGFYFNLLDPATGKPLDDIVYSAR